MSIDQSVALRIANQFVRFPKEKRRLILNRMSETGQSFRLLPIVKAKDNFDRIPLSYAQQRLLFLWKLDPNNTFYNVSTAVRLTGGLNKTALRETLDRLVQRHESLRTRFVDEDGNYFQIIDEDQSTSFSVVDMPPEYQNKSEQWIKDAVAQEINQPFDLAEGPLLRIKLFRLVDTEHVLIVCMHHIISDDWSSRLLIEEFATLYNSLVFGIDPALPELPIQYADYAIWQRSWLEAGEGEKQLAYWRDQLGDDHSLLTLPFDFDRPKNASFRGATITIDIPQWLATQLRSFTREKGYTLFMVMTAALVVTLSRYSGQSDIRIGAPNAGRNRSELEHLVGFFINTQVLRIQLDECSTFSQLLQQVKNVVSEAHSHQEVPFEQLVDELISKRSLSYNPLFQVKINQSVTADFLKDYKETLKIGDLSVEEFPLDGESSHFDLAFDFAVTTEGIFASFTYATDLFKSDTIERLSSSFKSILDSLVQHFDKPIVHYRDESAPIPDSQLIHVDHFNYLALWQRGFQLGRGKLALQFNEQTLSYVELDRQTNQLAQYLRSQGVSSESVVGVCLERSIEWVVSVLAILKAGAAYLPLDNQQPIERLRYFLQDSGAEYLIHHLGNENIKEFNAYQTIAFKSEQWVDCDDEFVAPAIDAQQTAYIIYTSGSTGQPKGVLVSHCSLANYVQGLQERLQLASDASMAIVSTIAADLGHTTLFSALAYGRLLHLLPHTYTFDPDAFANYMATHQVGILKIVPSHLQGLLQASQPEKVLPQHALILGGEICSWKLVEKIGELNPSCRVINHYGPTETTVGISTYEVDIHQEDFRSVPIGQSLPNSVLNIFDNYLNSVPHSVMGELYIGGVGVAQGYVGNAALTAERFVPDSRSGEGERCYRTGDWVRLMNNQLEFLGRTDNQIKIRGYRVEPNEVVNALKRLSEVQDAIVQAIPLKNDASHLQLVAYCILNHSITSEEIQLQLQELLPEHMVPTAIVVLDKFPLTHNGKLDRKALPKLGRTSQQTYEAPKGEAEQALAEIWAEVLGIEDVGRNDNFFALGGDSILSLKVVARARKRGINLHPQNIFGNPILSAIAEVINDDAKSKNQSKKKSNFTKIDCSITLMNKNGNKPDVIPLYCIVPWRGDIDVAYGVLARQIEMRRNVYGVTRVSVDKFKSIKDLAVFYLEEIKKFQKEGPYSFVGWSLSCITILHMASILEEQGQEVRFLGLIDSFLPGRPNSFFNARLQLSKEIAQHFVLDKEIIDDILDLADQYFNGLSEADLRLRILNINNLRSAGISYDDLMLAINTLVEYVEKEQIHIAIRDLPALNTVPHAYWAENTDHEKIISFCKLMKKPPISCTIYNTTHQTIVKNHYLARKISCTLNSLDNNL